MAFLHWQWVPSLWIAWVVYWSVSARNSKTSRRRESLFSRAGHLLPLAIAALLLMPSSRWHMLSGRFLPSGHVTLAAGTVCVAAGLLFTVWARVHLGGNWSGIVTLKNDHELIRTGPYHWVRHPIYSGLLLAFAGSAIALGEWRGVLAVAIAFAALWRKLRLEERWLGEAFGEAYARYRAEVAALIPFVL